MFLLETFSSNRLMPMYWKSSPNHVSSAPHNEYRNRKNPQAINRPLRLCNPLDRKAIIAMTKINSWATEACIP